MLAIADSTNSLNFMASHLTTSIRLPQNLRKRLEKRAKVLGRGKNWIISQALEEYLKVEEQEELERAARRQSLLASRSGSPEDASDWESGADFSDWK